MPDLPIGYLISTAVVVWSTLWAVAPQRSPPIVGWLSFYFGLIINEIPFLALLWLLAATLLAFGQGDIQSTGGWMVVGLAAITAVGLLLLAWRGMKAIPVLRQSLDDGLGPAWRAVVGDQQAARWNPRLHFVAFAGPFFRRRRDVEHVANLRYSDAGERNLLDVYHHRTRPANSPVLIHFHGGAMVRGKKNREALPMLYRLASQGWVCASANYRLQPANPFPDQLIDAKQAIAWMREHAAEFGGDPTTIFVAGGSAGAQLAVQAALTANHPTLQPGFETDDTSVVGVIGLYGYYGWIDGDDVPECMRSASIDHSQSKMPAIPFFVIHGDRDTITPVEETRHFVQRLRACSTQPVVYAELPGAQHNFDLLHSIRTEAVIDGVESFAAWVRQSASE